MKSTITTLNNIKKDNPRLCLSPYRALGKCFVCPQYDKCESKIITRQGREVHKLRLELRTAQKEYLQTIEEINKKIKKMESE